MAIKPTVYVHGLPTHGDNDAAKRVLSRPPAAFLQAEDGPGPDLQCSPVAILS